MISNSISIATARCLYASPGSSANLIYPHEKAHVYPLRLQHGRSDWTARHQDYSPNLKQLLPAVHNILKNHALTRASLCSERWRPSVSVLKSQIDGFS